MLLARRLHPFAHRHLNEHCRSLPATVAWKHSKSTEAANDFVYFHTPEVDLFWHYLERTADGQARSLDLSSSHYGQRQRQWHNKRIQDDWHDYRQGIYERPEKLQRLQNRLEKDMLDNAYVERTRQVLSAIRRGTHTSDAMAMQWMQAAQGASTFLQDIILFRDEPLERLAECGDVPWLPPKETVESYQSLLAATIAPSPNPPPDMPSSWVPLMALATPSLATAVASTRLQVEVFRRAFKPAAPGRGGRRRLPLVSRVTQDVGSSILAAANATALQLRLGAQRRGETTTRALFKELKASQPEGTPPVDSPVLTEPEQQLLRRLRAPPHVSQAESTAARAQLLARSRLGSNHVAVSRGTQVALGSVALQLLLIQLSSASRQPMFRQPVPWRFVPPGREGGAAPDFDIELSRGCIKQLAAYDAVVQSMTPLYGPCVAPPQPWVAPRRGCYAMSHQQRFRVELMRTKSAAQARALAEAHRAGTLSRHGGAADMMRGWTEGGGGSGEAAEPGLSRVYHSLNVLSSQAWSINTGVLEVVRAVDLCQENVGDVPLRTLPAVPQPTPPHFHPSTHKLMRAGGGLTSGSMLVTFQPLSAAAQQLERKTIAAATRDNANSVSQRGMFNMQLKAAQAHEHYGRIYFPHNIDFRGRAYPMPPHLNHMGADICRGLLQFADARPLGQHGLRWLLVHLANVCGVVDKHSFDRREAWAYQHLAEIVDSARRPLGGRRWWLKADKPWTALAVCQDITAALDTGDVRAYASRLPVHQDGSCNGLQHYAALGRDESGGRAVNLVDAAEPQDVYSMVASKFAEIIQEEARRDDGSREAHYARALLPHTDRKLVKQTVMTTVYGVTMQGARDQVTNRLTERGWPKDAHTQAVAMHAARRALSALEGLFSSAQIMTWLRRSAYTVARVTGRPVQWTTPLGLPVLQPYFKEERRASPAQPLPPGPSEDAAAPSKQSTAFPPNYVHSLDATHMMLTANACHQAGIAFAGVHDSFWTHAADVAACRAALREQFVHLYQQPLLAQLHADLVRSLEEHAGQEAAARAEEEAGEAAAVGAGQGVAPAAGAEGAAVDRGAVAQDGAGGRGQPQVATLITEPPEAGAFDLDAVLHSTYFFN
eukprot:jgi/Ulvmu1/3063/UM015_0103.1